MNDTEVWLGSLRVFDAIRPAKEPPSVIIIEGTSTKFCKADTPLPHRIPNTTITAPKTIPIIEAKSIKDTIHSFILGAHLYYIYTTPP